MMYPSVFNTTIIVAIVNILLSALIIETAVTTTGEVAIWKDILGQYRRWDGTYRLNDKNYKCTLIVHSIQKDNNGGMIAIFRDDNMVMEINGYTAVVDDCIDIKKDTMYNASKVFPKEDEFAAVVCLKYNKDMWTLVGNITAPVDKGFSVLVLEARASSSSVEVFDGNSMEGMRIGLAVGIPVALAIILSIVAVSMIVWAIKRGYLRHVPRNYKQFENNKMVELNSSTNTNPNPVPESNHI